MGYRPLRSLITVQLPLAIPVIGAGLRVAAVSNVSLVSVAALLGVPQLGQLFLVGFQLDFYTPIIAGIVLCLLVAGVFDAIILTRRAARDPVDPGGEAPMNGRVHLADDRRELVGLRRRAGPAARAPLVHASWRWPSRWSSRCRSAPRSATPAGLTGLVSGLANALRALPTLGFADPAGAVGARHVQGQYRAASARRSRCWSSWRSRRSCRTPTPGIAAVDPAARDAAKGMGMTGREVLTKVELPVALPLIMSGIRSAFLQVVATATIAAVVSLGGFGRYVIDGNSTQNYSMMVAGSILVAAAGDRRGPDPGADRPFRHLPRAHRTQGPRQGHHLRHGRGDPAGRRIRRAGARRIERLAIDDPPTGTCSDVVAPDRDRGPSLNGH